jgi:hypothetical protein
MGRLAARETAGAVDLGIEATASADKIAAFHRIISDLDVPILKAKFVYARLIAHLRESPLTINFAAYKFFNDRPKGIGYVSQFEGGSKWGDDSYLSARDEAEEAMFDYSGTKPTSLPGQVASRITALGKRSSPTFETSMRPRYAALNYARLPYGSAGQWGKSHMVLKEHVKHIATYLHTDSFDESGSARSRAALASKMANYFNLDRLIVNMPPAMLDALDKSSRGTTFTDTQVPGLGSTGYIEAHVHGELRFDRDIDKIVISDAELNSSEVETKKLKAAGRPFKVRTGSQIEKVFRNFARKNGIAVVVI